MSRRVAFVIPALERGGVERNVINLGIGLASKGFAVDLLVSRGDPSILSQLPKEMRTVFIGRSRALALLTFPLKLVSPRVRTSLQALPGLIGYLRRDNPGVVLSFQAHAFMAAAIALARVRPRWVVREGATVSAALAPGRRIMGALVMRAKAWAYRRADAVVANSKASAADLERMLRLPTGSVQVIYNPSFHGKVIEQSREPLDHPWFQPGQPPVLLGVGRLVPQKDFPTLIRSFRQVRAATDARLVILGEGADRSKLEALVTELGLTDDVELPGFVANPYAYMARSAVFVLSSVWEGLPNALIEALAIGTSVVSTDCPSGPDEILIGGAGGLLVPVGDPGAMAQAVSRLLQDAALAASLGATAQQHLGRFRPGVGLKAWVRVIDPGSDGPEVAVESRHRAGA